MQSQVLQLPYEIECPEVECAEGYTFRGAPYCGCFKPEDLPNDLDTNNQNIHSSNPTQTVDLQQLPFYYPGIPYSLIQQYLQQLQNQQIPTSTQPPGTPTTPNTANPSVPVVPPSTDISQTQIITNTSSTTDCNPDLIRCGSERTLDLEMCVCVCVQQSCPLAFQVFNQASCQCEPQRCPNTCTKCEVQNPSTCDCRSIVSCPSGRILDHETCQCFCNKDCSNELQEVNQNTCQCECKLFTTMVERVVEHNRVSRESVVREELKGLHRIRRKGKKNKKGRKKTGSGRGDSDIQVLQDSTSTRSKEKSNTREKSGKSKGRGTKTNSRRILQSTQQIQLPLAAQPPSPAIISHQQSPTIPQTVSAEVKVFRCPLGKVPNFTTCACN